MPKKYPLEFKRDVVTVARRGELTRAEVAADFGISEESVNRWMRQADIDDGIKDGRTTSEQSEIVQLRRDKRRLEMEVEILRRAADLLELAEPRRAMVRGAHHEVDQARNPPLREGSHRLDPDLDHELERATQAVRLAQDCRRNPRLPRQLLQPNL